ncbi:MAG: HD domain-containing protein [Candidatus Microthrix sp.]|nr:HD domain-containing protein [Candidatus Microthrix sp.]
MAALVAHYGGDEDQVISGVLHDVVEDHGGEPRAVEIGELFGTRVEAIVRDCSDSFAVDRGQKSPWRERKDAYLAKVAGEDVHAGRLVEACDKLANLRDIVEDLDDVGGHEALDRFNGGRDGTRWYYNELGRVLMPQVGNERLREADARELADLNRLCEVHSGT